MIRHLIGGVDIHNAIVLSADGSPLVEGDTGANANAENEYNEYEDKGDGHDDQHSAGKGAVLITTTVVAHLRYHQTGQVLHLL